LNRERSGQLLKQKAFISCCGLVWSEITKMTFYPFSSGFGMKIKQKNVPPLISKKKRKCWKDKDIALSESQGKYFDFP
jgi:hypothetical protein